MAQASPDHLGRTIAGRYLVEAVLGVGGMGEVFLARQAPLQRPVALKLIHRDWAQDPRLAARFEREARALAHLSNPHVVTLLDFGITDAGELFMAMELLEGETLRTRLRRVGALEVRAALRISEQICRGLAAAHQAGVVHRDLKPENIMLTKVSGASGSDDFVKVLDLGVARVPTGAAHQTLTEQGKLVGTPGYMAPEMLLYGALEDPRSDLYALGVILFEMLTGEAPFSAATPIALVMKHAHEAPRHLDSVWPEVDQLVQQLLRKEPGERPQDAAAVMRRIEEILALPHGETPRAVPVRSVDVNAATAPKLQTPLTSAPSAPKPSADGAPIAPPAPPSTPQSAAQSEPPSAPQPTPPPAPAHRRGALGVAAALAALALGGGALVALRYGRADEALPARADAGGTAGDATQIAGPAPQEVRPEPPKLDEPKLEGPKLEGPTQEPPKLDEPKPAAPKAPARARKPVASTPTAEPKPRHVPDLTP